MISRRSIAHAMIDALAAYGGLNEYYNLNHATAADIQRLEIMLTDWLKSVKIEIEESEKVVAL